MSTQLEQNLNLILNEKETKILPENIKKDVQIFDIVGTFTTNATATPGDITEGKTAYVNGEKVTGIIPELTPYTGVLTMDQNGIGSDGDGTIGYLNSSIDKDTIVRKGTNVSIMANNNMIANMIGLTADKIVKGNSFLGVEGTAETGSQINNQDKTITQNGQYTADSGYTGLGTVTVNVPSGSGDVKLFETVEAMQADPNPSEGDLAIVYRNEVQNATVDSRFQTATFPDTVVLDEAITDYIEVSYRAVDSSVMFNCWGSLDISMFRMNCRTESGSIRIEYTSSDGITYTRTDTTGNPVDFGTEIYYERPEMWNDAIGKFIQASVSTFEGLYKYTNYRDTDNIKLVPLSSINIDESTGRLVWDGETFIDKEIPIDKISQIKQLFLDDSILTTSTNYFFLFLNNDDKLCAAISTAGSSYANNMIIANYDSNTKKINEILGFTQNSYSTSSYGETNIYEIDIDSMTYTLKDTISEVSYTNSNSETCYYRAYSNIKSLLIGTTDMGIFVDYLYIKNLTNSARRITNESGGYYSDSDLYSIKSAYIAAPSQLTLSSPDELLPKKIAYGKNGVIEGNNDLITPNSSFNDTTAMLWTKIQMQYDEMEPRVLTDDDKTIDTSIYCIPTKMDGTPLYDTSNVTNMHKLLYGCSELTTIPLLNTSNVTSMDGMFTNCISLTKIPLLDTNGVTLMNNMFKNCTSLTTIPLLDASSVTDMGGMFYNCTSLTTIPLLDTSSVLYMNSMFYGCTSLTEIPLLDTSNITTMQNMFNGCTSLSDESLNNILVMCKNAVKITSNRTLKYIGLTEEQANICKTLSNYQDFVNAGWTTGY